MTNDAIALAIEDQILIDSILASYESRKHLVSVALKQLTDALHGSPKLMALIHSTKGRTKDPAHLRDKLERKMREAKAGGAPFSVTAENLLSEINDLAGLRVLHLHTRQLQGIDREIRLVFDEYRYQLVEEPTAITWDDESRDYFKAVGIQTRESRTMYTSVHYVVGSNSKTPTTCEIQVRTLAEELWGEVDHTMNYPHPSSRSTCREQIKVLARLTSTCSRLVDSIFHASDEPQEGPTARG